MLNVKRRLLQPFFNSTRYWRRRYRKHRTSGLGSYGAFAQFKAQVINDFLHSHQVESAIEFGCGDGSQLAICEYSDYLGVRYQSIRHH